MEEGRGLFEGLDEFEDMWFQKAFKPSSQWISGAEGSLRFTCLVNPTNRRLLRYLISPEGRQPNISNTPLVAWDVLEKRFAPTIAAATGAHAQGRASFHLLGKRCNLVAFIKEARPRV